MNYTRQAPVEDSGTRIFCPKESQLGECVHKGCLMPQATWVPCSTKVYNHYKQCSGSIFVIVWSVLRYGLLFIYVADGID